MIAAGGHFATLEQPALQRGRLTALLRTVLSPQGMEMVIEQMQADDILAHKDPAVFGADRYFVDMVGMPSLDRAWTLQFGTHHLAINATVAGPHVTLSPSFTGSEPVKFIYNGKRIYIGRERGPSGAGADASIDA